MPYRPQVPSLVGFLVWAALHGLLAEALDGAGAEDLVSRALQLHKEGDLHAAIELYDECLDQLGPAHAHILTSLRSNAAGVAVKLGELERAERYLGAVVEAEPHNPLAYFNVAVVQFRLRKWPAALESCEQALARNSSMSKVVHLQGLILQELGQEEQALALFADAASMESQTRGLPTVQALFSDLSAGEHAVINLPRGGAATVTCLASSPRLFVVEDFLGDDERAHITEAARPMLEQSRVTGASAHRKSLTAWVPLDARISEVMQRLSALLGRPYGDVQRTAEDLQVVQYADSGFFNAHHDSTAFHPRWLTALFYLSGSKGGVHFGRCADLQDTAGATWFPFVNEKAPPTVEESVEWAMARMTGPSLPGTCVVPRSGSLLIFLNHHNETGEIDAAAVHGGLPSAQDGKLIANYWLGF